MRIALLGANGMFGRDALPVFRSAGFDATGADLPDVDITQPASLERFFAANEADVVVNAAAYTDVDGAESHREEAMRVNALGALTLAQACATRGLVLVQISTDYVFPGTRPLGYLPGDPPGPAINAYGQSKLEGERAVRQTLLPDGFLICRTQWLYGRHGRNFVDTVLGLARTRSELRVVNDQWGVPTHSAELARQIAALLRIGARGVAHAVGGGGPVTWFDFASQIVAAAGLACTVRPCTSEEFPRAARRPAHAWLRSEKVPEGAVRHWRASLDDYLREKGEAAP